MNQQEMELDALKALGEWSKWLVSIETGVLALIIALKIDESRFDACLISLVLICLLFSIVIATFLLGGMPTAIRSIYEKHASQEKQGGNKWSTVYEIEVYGIINVKFFAFWEHFFFVVAIVLLVTAYILGQK